MSVDAMFTCLFGVWFIMFNYPVKNKEEADLLLKASNIWSFVIMGVFLVFWIIESVA